MNYLKLINAYWEINRDRSDFTAQVNSLYFTLLYFANKFEWKPFSLYREDITEQAKVSNNTYYSGRLILKDAGLIDFTEGSNKRTKCLFSVLPVYQIKDTKRTQEGHAVNSERTRANTIHNKPINLKTYKPINKRSVANATPHLKNNTDEKENSEMDLGSMQPINASDGETLCNHSLEGRKKLRTPGGARKKEKPPQHLFRDSPLFDKDNFIAAFEQAGFAELDSDHYHRALLLWSDYGSKKNPGQQFSHNWLLSLHTFVRLDKKNQSLVLKNKPAGQVHSRLALMDQVQNSIQYDANGKMI